MIEIKAPERPSENTQQGVKIFLAGSIEMGKAEKWQEALVKRFSDADIAFFNPRRTDWDSSWKQDPTPGTKFHEQVTWELDRIEDADVVVFYFDPKTQSPITLMELGYVLGNGYQNLVVCCPDGYFRKGNVVITCAREGIGVLNSFEELIDAIKEY